MSRSQTTEGAPGKRRFAKSEAGFALLIVVLTIAALALLLTPFMLSMRLQERGSRNAVAQTRARYAVAAAYNHALAQLLRASQQYADLAVRFDSLPVEFRWGRARRNLLLAAEVQDEQGKININTAPQGLLANLFADEDINIGLSRVQAMQLAAEVVSYRQAHGAYPTLESLCSEDVFTEARLNSVDRWQVLDALRRHMTVHSTSDGDGAFARININAATLPVLRAALTGVRMKHVEAAPGQDNAGDGAMSIVELSSGTNGTWQVTCTAVAPTTSTGPTTYTFAVTSVAGGAPAVDHGTVEFVEYPDSPAGVATTVAGVTFSIYNGTTPFAVDDTFTFDANRFSYDGDTYKEGDDNAVNTLLGRLRATVASADMASGTITLQPNHGLEFPSSGWVIIRGDLIHYSNRVGNELRGCSEHVITPAAGDAVTRVVVDAEELAAILQEVVDDDEITPADRSAIIANARDPDGASVGAVLLNATTGFCFGTSGRDTLGTDAFCLTTRGRYTIEAVGIVNDRAGREVTRMRIRRVLWLRRDDKRAGTSEPEDHYTWKLERQSDFDDAITGRGLAGLGTTPAPTYLADVPASSSTEKAGVTLAPISESGDGWGFDGPTLHGATNWKGTGRGPATTDTALETGDNLFKNGDRGLYVTAGSRSFTAFAAPAGLEVGDSLRRLLLWVKPDTGFNYAGSHVFFDAAPKNTDNHHNRIRLQYSAGQLVFRIADEANEPRSAEVKATVGASDFSTGAWHKVEALWSGMRIGQMALLLDGTLLKSYSPSGSDAEDTADPALMNEKWVALVGNYLKTQAGEGVRDTQKGAATGHVSVYGYGACRFENRDESTKHTDFDKIHRGGSTLSAPLKTKFVTRIKFVLPETGPLATDATAIPVEDAADFPSEGYVRIGSEIIKYSSRTSILLTIDQSAPDKGRGQDFGDTPATKSESSAAEHNDGVTVVCVSVGVSSNSNYPMPHHFPVPDSVEDWFKLQGLDRNQCMVQVDNEWISYTHRAGTGFLVNVLAEAKELEEDGGGKIITSSMRAAAGTKVADHSGGQNVIPVYRVGAAGRPGEGDRVTLLDDDLARSGHEELVVKRAQGSAGDYLVSFADFIPQTLSIYYERGDRKRNARIVKFPSGRYTPQRLVSIGSRISGTGGRADSVIGCVRLFRHSTSGTKYRLKGVQDAAGATTSDLLFGELDSIFDSAEKTEWRWIDQNRHFGVGSWPLSGYVNIGNEAFFYKVRYPHRITHTSAALGATTGSPSVTVPGNIAATGDIVCPEDPIAAGFNPYGGYLVIASYKKTETAGYTKELVCDDDLLQWLIDQKYLTEEQKKQGEQQKDGTWKFTEEIAGSSSTHETREYVFYSAIKPDTTGAGEYTFVCKDGRHLYDSNEDKDGKPLGHEDLADSPPPRLIGRTVAMTVLRRGALGTGQDTIHIGSRILPLPNLPATIMNASPLDEHGDPLAAFETDRIEVESTAAFPNSGYIQITDAGKSEIIYYTRKEQEPVPDSDPARNRYFLCGVKHFRGRFGTAPIDLTDLARLDDVRDTSDSKVSVLCEDTRRIVRLFRPRFHDRMPLHPQGDNEGAYAPHPADSDMVYFEVRKTVRGARWKSVDWEQGHIDPTTGTWTTGLPAGTQLVVLARVGDSPDWGTAQPVMWNAVPAGSGRVIYKFDTPKTDPDDPDQNKIDAVGDTITIRVFFKFLPGYYETRSWQVPVLRSLSVKYEANPMVLESQELSY